jgi:glucokinase
MNTQINFPLFLPGRKSDKNNKISILAADIGGTKTNVGWFESEDGMLVLKEEATYSSKTHQSFSHIIQKFIREYNLEKPNRISIGVAGPVLNGKCITTNLPWSLDIIKLKMKR